MTNLQPRIFMDSLLLKKIFGSWEEPLSRWKIIPQLNQVLTQLNPEYETKTVYPGKKKVFRVFKEVPYDELKVVMLFQDPYHDGSATGIAVANEPADESKSLSPTLRILMEEWQEDPATGDSFDASLLPWCKQGVLLLNCALTVEKSDPGSHLHIWRGWTEKLLVSLSMEKRNLIYILLGKKAQSWKEHIINGHLIYAPHPAAEVYARGNAGFYGSRIFTRANENLSKQGKQPIIW